MDTDLIVAVAQIVTGIATLAKSDMTKPDDSFINSARNIKSSSLSLLLSN